MLIVRGESALPAEELLERAMRNKIVLLSPRNVGSVEELELAYALAKKSVEGGKAIGRSIEVEFVLWLAGKRDIRRAFEEIGWREKEFIAVAFGMGKKELVKELEMKEKKLGLKKEAPVGDIEKISLSRIV